MEARAFIPALRVAVPAMWQNLVPGWTTFNVDIPISPDRLHRHLSWALRLRRRALHSLRRTGIRAAGEIFSVKDEILEMRGILRSWFHANLRRGECCATCGIWRKRRLKVLAQRPEPDPVVRFLVELRQAYSPGALASATAPLAA